MGHAGKEPETPRAPPVQGKDTVGTIPRTSLVRGGGAGHRATPALILEHLLP